MAGIKRTGEQNKCQNSRQINKTIEYFRYNDNTDNVATKSTSLVAQGNKGSMNISQPLEGYWFERNIVKVVVKKEEEWTKMVFLVNDNTDNVATKSTSLVAQGNKGSMNISQPLEGILISLWSNDRLRRTIPHYGAPTNLVGLRGERRRWVLPIRQRILCTSTAERESTLSSLLLTSVAGLTMQWSPGAPRRSKV